MNDDAPLQMPALRGAEAGDGWREERLRYRVQPRDKPKFNSVLDAETVFGKEGGETAVTTRTCEPENGETVLELSVTMDLGHAHFEDRFEASWSEGLVARRLRRTVGEARYKDIAFDRSPFPLPPATYPEVLTPFLLRAQPFDAERRALYAWTSDRFVARVYYERHGKPKDIELPFGSAKAIQSWLYPDLNDWVSMPSVLTKMSKPFLPRYAMWFDAEPPRRLLRFEGSYGPPGAPEIVLELLGAG